jgi:hypothetical protein
MQDSTTFAPPAEAEKRARAIVKAATTSMILKLYLKSAKIWWER